MKKLLSLCLLVFALASCSPKTCPTYAKVEPVEKDRFSNAEKFGAVMFVVFAIYATGESK